VSTRELIDKEIASLPEDLQRRVYDFVMRLKQHARDEIVQRCRAERICSRARLEFSRRGCRVVKPVAGEVVCHTVSANRRKAPTGSGDCRPSGRGLDSLSDHQPREFAPANR
jgi:hypothetical protein